MRSSASRTVIPAAKATVRGACERFSSSRSLSRASRLSSRSSDLSSVFIWVSLRWIAAFSGSMCSKIIVSMRSARASNPERSPSQTAVDGLF
jgi:hypothetical protein